MIKKRKILHIVKDNRDATFLEYVNISAVSYDVLVVFTESAARGKIPLLRGAIFILSDDVSSEEQRSFPHIGYDDLLDMVFDADIVMTW